MEPLQTMEYWQKPDVDRARMVLCFVFCVRKNRLFATHGANQPMPIATYVGPGHWFELPDSFFRLGYGWPTREELEGGMKAISAALRG